MSDCRLWAAGVSASFALLLATVPVAEMSGQVRGSEALPQSFASRAAAEDAGCDFAPVEGPTVDACILTGFAGNQMDVIVYVPSGDSSYRTSQHLVFPSWYWSAKLSFVNVAGTDWLAIATEGMHGTGIAQHVLLVIAWDGTRFRTIASESLDYGCFRPTSDADYRLAATYAFDAANNAVNLRLDYELSRDDQQIGAWNDTLRWNPGSFRLEPLQSAATVSNPLVESIRQAMTRARGVLARTPIALAAASGTAAESELDQMGNSGLLDVLTAACDVQH